VGSDTDVSSSCGLGTIRELEMLEEAGFLRSRRSAGNREWRESSQASELGLIRDRLPSDLVLLTENPTNDPEILRVGVTRVSEGAKKFTSNA